MAKAAARAAEAAAWVRARDDAAEAERAAAKAKAAAEVERAKSKAKADAEAERAPAVAATVDGTVARGPSPVPAPPPRGETKRVDEMLLSLFADDPTKHRRFTAAMVDDGIDDEVVDALTHDEMAEIFGNDRDSAALAVDWLAPEVPDHLKCPITHELFVDPVMCDDGFSYERAAIEMTFARIGLKSPKTGLPVKGLLFANVNLRQGCEEWAAGGGRGGGRG